MTQNIKTILMQRDQMTSEQADALIREAVDDLSTRLEEGDIQSAYDICMEYFGLEPDYLEEMLEMIL
jgi:hypothetical protein